MIKTITYNPETHVLVTREPNPDWCAGCSPDNCSGCGAEPVDSEPAMWVMKHIRSGDLAQAKPNQKALHPRMWSQAHLYTTPQPDRTAELEQLRQRVAELKKERDELKLVVSAHADFFSRTQSEMADLKESVECLSATNCFLAGKRDENIILKAAVKQLTAELNDAIATTKPR